MNQKAICIILNVENDSDFENIISNDPGLLEMILEIDTVVPYNTVSQ